MSQALHPSPRPRAARCPLCLYRPHWRPGTAPLAAALLATALHLTPAPARAQAPADETLSWRCQVVYMPARSTWVRGLALRLEGRRIAEMRIDAQPVHTFAVEGTLLLTSMDNERIAIDVAGGQWTSDFRGAATGRGRCEREPVATTPAGP
jgi:hypothetical protein